MASSPASVLAPDRLAVPARLQPGSAGTETSTVVLLALLLGLLTQAGALLNDPDTQWHMAVGRWIVANGTVPWTDLFSHTFAGQPWIAKEWASQLILFGAYAGAGWWGVAVLAAVVVAASLAWLHHWLGRSLNAVLALAAVVVAFAVLAPHLLARPHIFIMPVLLAWTIGLVTAVERGTTPSPWLLLAMAAWANLHGSYPIGLVIAGMLAGEGVVTGPRSERRARAARWALFLGAATLAACATPYGYRPFLVNLGLFGSGESLRFITEWQPLGFDLAGTLALIALVLCLGTLVRAPRTNLFRIGLLAILGTMMIRHSRFADLFILVAPVVMAGPFLSLFPGLAATARPPGRIFDKLVVAALALAVIGFAARIAPEPNPAVTPTAALEAARMRGLTGPVYNHYDFGGFLIAAGVETFIDGRADQIFLGGFMNGLDRAVTDPESGRFAALLDRYGVTWALVRRQGDDVRHLSRMEGWALLHRDDVAAVFYDTRAVPQPGPWGEIRPALP